MNILKGIGAILAGMVFIVVTHTAADFVLERLGIFTPPDQGFHTTWMVVTATIYRSIFTIGGGYITATHSAFGNGKARRYRRRRREYAKDSPVLMVR